MSLSLLAAGLAAAFAAVVGGRWRASRRPAFAAWAAGLVVFSAAAGAQAIGEHAGFTPTVFRAFYLLGGILGVAYLALGTLYLGASRRVAHRSALALAAVSVISTVAVLMVSVDPAKLGDTAGVLGDAMSGPWSPVCRALAAVTNSLGTVVLVGGSAQSAHRLWRTRAGVDRVVCNVLLTVGALVIAGGLSFARVRGDAAGGVAILGGFEAVGIAIMFAGFLALGRVGRRPLPVARAAGTGTT